MDLILPAIFFGGPPHAGKSTLVYRLSQALRAAGTPHYALRASPDGEGDWWHEGSDEFVRVLRNRAKTGWTPDFAERITRDVSQRHLPLLVDAGGRITPETRRVAAACTYAVLLARSAAEMAAWRTCMQSISIPIIAELLSVLDEEAEPQTVQDADQQLTGTITGLDKQRSSDGIAFDALLALVQSTLAVDEIALYKLHASMSRCDHVVDLDHVVPNHAIPGRWEPNELADLAGRLDPADLVGIYGRGPAWVYATLGALYQAAPRIFTTRQGWIDLPLTTFGLALTNLPMRLVEIDQGMHIICSITDGHIDREELDTLSIPICPREQGVVISGKLPLWLYAALARGYRAQPWVAVYQPQLKGAVVVSSSTKAQPLGSIVPIVGQ